MPTIKSTEEWIDEGNTYSDLQQYEEALIAYQQALQIDPNYAQSLSEHRQRPRRNPAL